MKNMVVTGPAGFIGSHLVDRLLEHGHKVTGIDNFSTGQRRFLEGSLAHPNFRLIECDLLEFYLLKDAFAGAQVVFHLAANADVRGGVHHPHKDLQQNTIATFNVLEAMRAHGIKDIIFSSTGAVYGEATVVPTPENGPFPIQTSLYGASKLACEGLIQAYCEGFGFKSWIFRFVSILGERYSHGHIFDFYKKLLENPDELLVLGDGRQKKSYLHVRDCIDAMLFSMDKFNEKVNVLNLGANEYCEVNNSVAWITEYLKVKPNLKYSGGKRGWIGDNPFVFLDTGKVNNAGWKPKFTIKDSIIKTLNYLQNNHWVMETRK